MTMRIRTAADVDKVATMLARAVASRLQDAEARARLSRRQRRAAVRSFGSIKKAARAVKVSERFIADAFKEDPVHHEESKDIVRTIQVAGELGLDAYLTGSCGPAAVAINRVLWKGKKRYCIVKQNRTDGWHGHVAIMHNETLYDYAGDLTFNDLVMFVDIEQPFVIELVDEKTVKEIFCPRTCLPVARAVRILKYAVGLGDIDPKSTRSKAKLRRAYEEIHGRPRR